MLSTVTWRVGTFTHDFSSYCVWCSNSVIRCDKSLTWSHDSCNERCHWVETLNHEPMTITLSLVCSASAGIWYQSVLENHQKITSQCLIHSLWFLGFHTQSVPKERYCQVEKTFSLSMVHLMDSDFAKSRLHSAFKIIYLFSPPVDLHPNPAGSG